MALWYDDKMQTRPPAQGGGGTDPKLTQRVTALEANKADRTDVQAVWDEMAAAVREGVNEV